MIRVTVVQCYRSLLQILSLAAVLPGFSKECFGGANRRCRVVVSPKSGIESKLCSEEARDSSLETTALELDRRMVMADLHIDGLDDSWRVLHVFCCHHNQKESLIYMFMQQNESGLHDLVHYARVKLKTDSLFSVKVESKGYFKVGPYTKLYMFAVGDEDIEGKNAAELLLLSSINPIEGCDNGPRLSDSIAQWSQWQLLDSLLPTGGFANSFGLEASVQSNLVSNPDELKTFIIYVLENTGGLLLPFVHSASVSPKLETWLNIDKILDATLTNEVSRKALISQGWVRPCSRNSLL